MPHFTSSTAILGPACTYTCGRCLKTVVQDACLSTHAQDDGRSHVTSVCGRGVLYHHSPAPPAHLSCTQMDTCLEVCTCCVLCTCLCRCVLSAVCASRLTLVMALAVVLWFYSVVAPCDVISCSHTSHTPALRRSRVVACCTNMCRHGKALSGCTTTTDYCTAVSEPGGGGGRRCGGSVAPALHVSKVPFSRGCVLWAGGRFRLCYVRGWVVPFNELLGAV